MKVAQFNELCHREHDRDGGTVSALHLTQESYAELLTEILGDGPVQMPPDLPSSPVGARLDAMTNPATRTVVNISRAPAFVPDTAEVTHWVPIPQPIGWDEDGTPVYPEPGPAMTLTEPASPYRAEVVQDEPIRCSFW